MNGWELERQQRQAKLIQQWQPGKYRPNQELKETNGK